MCAALVTPIIKGEYKLYHGMPVTRKPVKAVVHHYKEKVIDYKRQRMLSARSSPDVVRATTYHHHREKSYSFSRIQTTEQRKETLRRILEEKERRRRGEPIEVSPPSSPSKESPIRKFINRLRRSFSNDHKLSALRDVKG